MAFHFALQPILRLRQSLEDRERLKLGLLVGYIARVDDQCRQLDLDRRQLLESFTERLPSGISAAELQFGRSCATTLQRNRGNLLIQRARLEREKAAQELALLRAQRRRKIIEELKERQLESYRVVQRRVEQLQMDDLHSARGTNRS